MSRKNVEDIYPLSPLQQGILFHTLAASTSGVYVVQRAWSMEGPLDAEALARAFQAVVDRHAILRTAFVWDRHGRPMQVVREKAALPFETIDLRGVPAQDRTARAQTFAEADRARGFELTRAPLMRVALIRLGEAAHRLVWTTHHLLLDGWSTPLVTAEVFRLYEALVEGRAPSLARPRPYGDYIGWREKQDGARSRAFFREALRGLSAPTPLGVDRPPSGPARTGEVRVDLPDDESEAVAAFARQHHLTPGTVLLGAWAILLARYAREDDVTFGVTLSGRSAPLPGIEAMIGMFINTLPLRVRVDPEAEAVAFLSDLHARQGDLHEHEHTSLVDVQGVSDVPRGTPLFESVVVFENYPYDADRGARLAGLALRTEPTAERTDLPLTIVGALRGRLHLRAAYDARRFDEATARRLLGHLRALVLGMIRDPRARLGDLSPLTAEERRDLLATWNDTAAPAPREACVHHLFEAQADRTPDAVAVIAGDAAISYRALAERARRVAHLLRAMGVGPGAVVGVCARRSPDLVAALLGVLEAGGAYLPLDPAYPEDRLAFMVADAGARVVITESPLQERLGSAFGEARMLCLDADREAIGRHPATREASDVAADDLAYVMYTSGSTGRPKGVMIPHRGVVSYLDWAARAYRVAEGPGAPVHSSIGFDLTVTSLFVPLVAGRAATLLPEDAGVDGLAAALRAGVGYGPVKLTPSHLEALSRILAPADAARAARVMVVGGEALTGAALAFFQRNAPDTRIVNEYGPTETVVGCAIHEVPRGGATAGAVPIGRPVARTHVHVLDARGELVPVGVAGELYVGGDQVGRGYLGRPDLTAERFVPDPFDAGSRLYRTGDLVRRLPSGELEYVGRLDQQVKIRGHRVELGEIEAVIADHPAVREVAVLAREDAPGDRRLVAYVVSAEHADLAAWARRRLPEPMVPSAWVTLPALPLTENGKVDRRALPAPGAGPPADHAIVPPRGPLEEALAAIFAEVLRLDASRVGAHASFFDLGGHSLLAAAAVARVRAAFGVDLPIAAIFEARTPAELGARVQAALGADLAAPPPVERRRDGALVPLSFAQERLWFLAELDPGDLSYLVPIALRVAGPLDRGALGRALGEIVRRHEVLRTAIVPEEGRPVARLLAPEAFTLVERRASAPAPADRDEGALREAEAEARRPLDLARGPFRATLVALGDADHLLLLTVHHVAFDGWSQGILHRELGALYASFAAGAPSPLPELPFGYADFAAWQRRWLDGDVTAAELAFWKDRLAGAPRVLDLPADRPRPRIPSHRGARAFFRLPDAVARGLRDLARREGATPFMVTLAVFDALLHRMTGALDVVVGTPIAGRARAEVEGLIGLFANTLVLRAEIAAEAPFRALVSRVKDACLAAYAHQDLPFERLVAELSPERDPARSPLFQVGFTLQAEPGAPPALPGLDVRRVPAAITTAKIDLTLALFDGPEGLGGAIDYAADLFDAATIERLAGHFTTLAAGVCRDPEAPIADLPILSDAERADAVVGWNRTAAPHPEGATIHGLFEAQVDRAPDAIAIVFEDQHVSYGTLDALANRLAHHLARIGVGREARVGVSMRRTPGLVVAILAALKAGAAWVPIDPAYPEDRRAFMMDDAGLALVITDDRIEADRAAILAAPDRRPPAAATADDAAYVIYTSGSTGRPKGVVVEHRGLGNVAEVHRRAFGAGPGSRVLQLASPSFDASVWEMVMALLTGGTLVLAHEDALLPGPDLVRVLAGQAVTILTVSPSVLAALPHADLPALETIVAAGEACSEDLVVRWAQGRRFWNAYGPTEATICATLAACSADGGRPSIGRPIANVQVFLLDARMAPVPVGVPGELCIGGAGVARGYLRRPDLTAERFVPSPFGPGRLYRTGDLARRRPDGSIDFLGRIDHQVKLRGFRVELGEVEAALRQCPGVSAAAVLLRNDRPGDPRLVAYVVLSTDAAPSPADLRAFLAERLPAPMVPASFVRLAAMPLTPSGKVDRRALPAPAAEEGPPTAARGPIEEAVAAIFAEVLGTPEVGAHDGFFALGGHSLLATRAVARVRAAFGVDVPLRALFEAPSPAGLAAIVGAMLAGGPGSAPPPIVPVPRGAALPPSFAQERLWFLAQLAPDDPSYVIPSAFRLRGRLDADALRRALGEIVRRHEVLRTGFASVDGRPAQVIHDPPVVGLPITDLAALPDGEAGARREAAAEAQRPFDLATGAGHRPGLRADEPPSAPGPMLRARLLRLGEDDHVLLVAQHHIASDGWSQSVLFHEIGALYGAFAAGRPSPLPDLAIQYVDFAVWQRRWLSGEVLDRQLAYWRDALTDAPSSIDLPADRPRPPVASHRGARRSFTLPVALGRELEALGRGEGATLFMTLLAAFAALLHRVTGQTDLLVGTPIAGRTHAETEPLLGLFANTLVLRARVDPDRPFRALLAHARETCLGAYAHQDMPFERLVAELSPDRDLSRAPLFQVMFTLQNEPRVPLSLPGIEVTPVAADHGTAKLDLSLAMGLRDGTFGGVIEYATDLFDEATVDRMIAHLGTLLAGIAGAPGAAVGDLPLLPEEERRLVITAWNDTAAPYPEGATLHGLFEAQALLSPDAIALVFEDQHVSYGALDARANRIARRLARMGVGPESRVGISLRRSPDLWAAALATLKAGGAWVPIDPAYPEDRRAFMREDAALAAVLDDDRLEADRDAILAEPGDPLAVRVTADHAAYVIYTSGSTGRPKGVVVTHRGLGSLAEVHRRAFGAGPGSRVLQLASPSFDASVWEMVMALLTGATLVLAPAGALLPGPDLVRTLADHAVSIVTAPPSALAAIPSADLPALETIVAAGEACSEDVVRRWAAGHRPGLRADEPPFAPGPGRRFWNAYGPTETTICATMGECSAGGGKPAIGKPIANVRVYLLDGRMGPVPVGVAGEICVGGVGIARGYLNRPDRTAEAFVPSPFGRGERLYRTGDRARRLPDGSLDFLGRVDHQVKIRGFRVELGEIDAALRLCPGVADAIAAIRDDAGDPRLAAYFVPANDPGPTPEDVRAFLRERLPEPMVPAYVVRIAAMPRTSSGKVDRAALPAPEIATDRPFVAPRGPIEEAIAGIYAEVLRAPRVAAHDGFFDLGGHSLLATQAAARVRDAFGVDLPLRAIFEAPTVAGLAAAVQAALSADARAEAPPLARVDRTGDLVLSFAEERLWFLDQLEPGDASYVVPLALRLEGPLDAGALGRALDEIVRRHEVLRRTFASRGGKPVPVLHEPTGIGLATEDLGSLPAPDREAAARREAARAAELPFDLARGPLVRARLLRLATEDHILLLSTHHVSADGWSLGVLGREIGVLYAAFAAGLPSPLPDLPVQYVDYAAWQRRWMAGDRVDRQIAYWKEALAGAPRAIDLPLDRPRPAVPSHRGGSRTFEVPAATRAALAALARGAGATPFMTLLAAFFVLLHRHTGERDLVVGAPIAGRTRAELEPLVGFFTNTLVLRAQIDDDAAFSALLREVRETCLGAYAHQDVPFERLVQEIDPDRDPGRTPLFQVTFTLQNAPGDPIALPGLAVRGLGGERTTAKFDLSLALAERGGALFGSIEYAADLFDAATVERMAAHLVTLLAGVAADPARRPWELPILGDEERRQIEAWSAAAASFPPRACLHELFEAQADRDPDAVAVTCEGESLTYGELDLRASRIAHLLRRRGVGPDVLVGLCVERSLDTIVGMLGILEAGGAYVPLDPAYPRDRLAFMVEDAGVSLVVTHARHAGVLPPGAALVRLDAGAAALAAEPSDRPARAARPDSLAYVLYTSGSTGKPKGVMVTHHNVVRLFDAAARVYRFDARDVWTMFHSHAFDFSVWEIWGALLHGARLVVVPYWMSRDPSAFHELLAAEAVTVLDQTPSAFRQLVRAEEAVGEAGRRALALRYVIFGGEALDPDDLRPWWDRHGDDRPALHNMYGITETTVHVTHRRMTRADLERPWSSVIGRPLADLSVHVLDAHGTPVPVGVAGEIHVGGAGVSRGYLNRPDLTAERFAGDPFHAGGRLYRTGDRARRLPSGDLEYLGRADQQVKIRGFRIELGEIEAALGRHPAVRDAVVIAREDSPGDRRLVAYFVLVARAGAAAPSSVELRAFLRTILPEPMVPAAFVALDALPLGPTGKIDRRALPAPGAPDHRASAAPHGPIEEAIAGIWADVLGVAEVGADDGFFDLGGHSLLATQAIARMRDALGADVPLRALFEAPTVAGVARAVEAFLRSDRSPAEPLARAPRDGPVVLSFAQERLWLLDQITPGDAAYIVPTALRIEGPLDVAALERALGEIVRRHEVLRTTFAASGGHPFGVVRPWAPIALPVVRRPALSAAEREAAARRAIAADARRPFDLAEGPLLRAQLFEIGDEDHVLSLTQHHVVSDAWSQGVLFRELSTLYAAFAAGDPSPLPDLPIQYADFAAWQRGRLAGDALAREIDHWKRELAGAPAAIDLPTDRPRPPVQTHAGARLAALFPMDLCAAVRGLARAEGATLFMVLLAALDVLLFRTTGQTDLVVGTPIAGRTRAETEGLLGFFVNTLVLRARVDPDRPFRALVACARETCLAAYAHQDMPFERLVNEIADGRDLARAPLFQVMLALQNAGGATIDLPGLHVRGFGAESETSKFDLTVVMGEVPGGLSCSIEYATDLFDESTIARTLGRLRALLEGAAAHPDAPLRELPFLADEDRRLLASWDAPVPSPPPHACLHELFEAQADRTPDAIAVTFEDGSVTYGALDARANRLAHALRRRGAGPEVLVGLSMDRSIALVVAILGILKAGAAYLPLDPSYPRDRLAFMIEDARVSVVIADAPSAEGLAAVPGVDLLVLDAAGAEPATRPPRTATPESLAYVIYTSGSTGRPKGVMVGHHHVVRLFEATRRWFGFDAAFVWTMFHAYAFDFSVWEIWGPLLHGGRLVIVPHAVSRAPDAFRRLLAEEGVTMLSQTPSAFRQLVRADEAEDAARRPLSLRHVVFGGEALDLNDLRPWWDRHGDEPPRLVNMYGITETTVHVTYRPLARADLDRAWSSVIGRPIPDLRVHVLDAALQAAPVGIPGELYVGGAGVARGYLARPDLTAERFLPDPFGPGGGRLYKTGDRARLLASGDLEYLGRADQQVKIRGFRVEPGEIEAAIEQHPAVREAVVVAREDVPGDRRLVAYLVLRDGARPAAADLRAFAKQRLPEMMVPAAFVTLGALPLTENGKIDRRALPAPDGGRPDLEDGFVAPATAVEQALARIWAAVLRVPAVGVHDNFFEIGGDSILSIQIVARAQQEGLRLTPRQIFQHPTIAELAAAAGEGSATPVDQGPVTGPVPLTPIQRWWLDGNPVDPHHHDQAFLLEAREPLDAAALHDAVAHLLTHHDALRLRLTRTEAGFAQALAAPGGPVPFEHVDLSGLPEDARGTAVERAAAEAQASLDLASGPLVRVVLFDTGAGASRLLVVVHHLAVDGVSWRILLDDLWTAYDQRARGLAIHLPPKTTSFKAWAERLADHARSDAVTAELDYWLAEARARVPPLPVDLDGDPGTEADARSVVVHLTPEETAALLREAPEAYQTRIDDLLLTAWAQAFAGLTGSRLSLVDREGHGREDLFAGVDLTRTVGWFTVLYPLLLDLPPGGPAEAIKSIKEQIRAVPGHGIGHGLLRWLRDGDPAAAALARLPAPDVSFNYLGQLDQALPEASPLRFARGAIGPSTSPRARRRHLLDITASVSGGRLSVQWTYSETRHRRATVEDLAARFLAALRALLAHCLSPEAGGYTPSDFQEQGLTQGMIDMLADLDDDDP
jgi:amino acid adenylation domain-containing protein/non-ribosomal peptide synthase protein (TIGR01720 family)